MVVEFLQVSTDKRYILGSPIHSPYRAYGVSANIITHTCVRTLVVMPVLIVGIKLIVNLIRFLTRHISVLCEFCFAKVWVHEDFGFRLVNLGNSE